MAKRVVLVPLDFISHYHQQKSEFTIEDENLLNKSNFLDETIFNILN